jgi:hypothetical protein
LGTKKRVTINTKITEEESEKLRRVLERENISSTAVLRLLIDGLLNGEIELEKGEIKSCPTHDEYCVSEISEEEFKENLRYKELKLDRLVKAFERNGYPDQAIRQSIEQIICQVMDNGKYNPRRRYDSDCGC